MVLTEDALKPPDVSPAANVRRHAPMVVREQDDHKTTSTNWSGYAVTGAAGSVTNVKGSWIIPAIEGGCSSTNQFSSFWVGIDGFNSSTVEQLGTDSDCQHGAPVYFAWFEIFPFPSFTINSVQVSPGDHISAEVSFHNHRFILSMTNVTTGKSFSTTVRARRATELGGMDRGGAVELARRPAPG